MRRKTIFFFFSMYKFYYTILRANIEKDKIMGKIIYRTILVDEMNKGCFERLTFRDSTKSFLRRICRRTSTKLIGILAARDNDHFLIVSTKSEVNTPIHPEFTGNTEDIASLSGRHKLFKGACQLPVARDPDWTCNRKSYHVAHRGWELRAEANCK